ncbi:MAG TPA: alpha/beta hydrolase [Streptosporangiaceae bacterium]|nr:alpha/beta hydrolase [Streptosporangiaceae bacterium]
MSKGKALGIAGAAVGLGAAAGIGAAVGISRYAVGRVRFRPDPQAGEPLGTLRGRSLTVLADDGLPLHVEVDGPDDAPLTLVFCHGYTLNQHAWHYQRRDLKDRRMVFWDQRSHGRSGRSKPTHATIDQTGADLHAVLRATVRPDDKVVLIGHSMGGMSIMALAESHPELFGDQVVAAALINTSAGRLKEMTLGLPLVLVKAIRPFAPGVVRSLGSRAQFVEQARRAAADVSFIVTRRLAFANKEVSPTIVDFLEQMIRSTPIDVIAEFYPALMAHDKAEALEVLGRVPTVVMAGGTDRLTPAAHGRAIADAVPGSELVEIPTAGHVLMLEFPDLVTEVLRGLLNRVPAARDQTDGTANGAADDTAEGAI